MTMSRSFILSFFCGIVFGGSFTILAIYHGSLHGRTFSGVWSISRRASESDRTPVAMTKEDYTRGSTKITTPSYSNVDKLDNSSAVHLYEKVRVLCWVMTSPATLRSKAIHVRNTWSKRCNVRLFISSKEDKEFPAVGLPLKEGRDQLYEKTKAAFKYIWEHYKDQADWFMKADDDTYVVVENLRYLLKDYNPSHPMFFGRKFKPFIKQGYMSGGAGYVLSKEALRRYVDGLDTHKCGKGGSIEDVEIGKCMESVGVVAGDSRDAEKRETFFPLGPRHHLIPDSIPKDNWFWKYNFYPTCLGQECCSNYVVTFHYVTPNEMYVFDYFIYSVEVYGRTHLYKRNPSLWSDQAIAKNST